MPVTRSAARAARRRWSPCSGAVLVATLWLGAGSAACKGSDESRALPPSADREPEATSSAPTSTQKPSPGQAPAEVTGAASPAPTATGSTTATDTAQRPALPQPLTCWGQGLHGRKFTPAWPIPHVGADAQPRDDRSLADSSQRRFTWVNFWASWCTPCIKELPLLKQWQERLGDRVRFVFVSLDNERSHVERFLEQHAEHGLTQSYWLPEDQRTRWLNQLGLEAHPDLPMQLLLDPSGKVHCHVRGAVSERNLPFVEQLLAR